MKSNFIYLLLAVVSVTYGACNQAPKYEGKPGKEKLFPEIFESGSSTYQKTNELRFKIAATINTGNFIDSTCENYTEIAFNDFDPAIYIDILRRNKATTMCDLAARLYTKILNDNGIEAYTYNFGIDGTKETHVVSLVKLESDTETETWILQDAYYNYTINDTLGNPKDFLVLLGELRDKNFSNMLVSEDTVYRDLLLDMNKIDLAVADTNCRYMVDRIKAFKDTAVLQMPISYSNIHNQPCEMMNTPLRAEKKMAALGYPRNFFYAYLFQLGGVWGAENPSRLQAKIEKALAIP